MLKSSNYRFREVEWFEAAGEILEIRQKVFVVEQRFDKQKISDRLDERGFHVIVSDSDGLSVGCGRLVPDGRIGKIAVLITHRGNGIGTQILARLVAIAKGQKIGDLSLNAEAELVNFYDQQKFFVDGPVYMKQGIPFQRMAKKLA